MVEKERFASFQIIRYAKENPGLTAVAVQVADFGCKHPSQIPPYGGEGSAGMSPEKSFSVQATSISFPLL